MKKILSTFMALLMAVSLLGVTASAARVNRIRIISPRSTEIRVNRTLTLETRITPSDGEYHRIEWDSSDWRIADVDNYDDEYADIIAYRVGTTVISVRVFDENNRRLASDSIEITVTGPGGSTGGGSGSGGGNNALDRDPEPSNPPAVTDSKISAATVTSAVRANAVRGQTSHANFRGYSSVASATLKSANTEMQRVGGVVLLNFDTMNATNTRSVEGRLTINPRHSANLTGDIQLGVYTNDGATGSTRRKFERFFSNRVVVIKAMQKGSYGMPVNYAVKIGTDLANARQLMLYSYDPVTNRAMTINNSNIWLDRNGYVHFTTNLGDDLVIADGALRLR
ncbi:MAG: hypothetical protein FWG94_10505 [Oscillospiraceae bacterium]|nr:hypothetical protein [Oscillospiraceae bacterium]